MVTAVPLRTVAVETYVVAGKLAAVVAGEETVVVETVAVETGAVKTVAEETVAVKTAAGEIVAGETAAGKTVAVETAAGETDVVEMVAVMMLVMQVMTLEQHPLHVVCHPRLGYYGHQTNQMSQPDDFHAHCLHNVPLL